MWKFKPFAHKEQTGLEGRIIDIGNYKVQIRNVIAEGGFSSVYLAREALHGSKQFALKHIICNDQESEELVMKEISVMKSLKGHPNVVTLYSHAIFDMGRTKEALLLMEYCEKSLVNVLESRGVGFFDEKQVLTIFRDVCNAVFAMHCQAPPIAHRDLKAENILLGPDGLWKLCDFGSTTTNHKRFEKPEEMGIEEDNIRKYTTPAYRSPEMWDLFRRELINEKVDIWALGCLLFRICYFKSAFDGESKLQILNGNYRIPDLPKYNTLLIDLIKDMLQSSPDDRPDITQVWFRVNDLLPEGLKKSLPDRPPEMPQNSTDALAGIPKHVNKSSPMPRRSPPPPPTSASESPQNTSTLKSSRSGESIGGPLGSFWNTQHAKEDTTEPKFLVNEIRPERHSVSHSTPPHVQKNVQGKSVNNPSNINLFPDDSDHSTERLKSSLVNEIRPERHSVSHSTPPHVQKNVQGKSVNKPSNINLFPDDSDHSTERLKSSRQEVTPAFQNDAFNAFVAEFDVNKRSSGINQQKPEDQKMLDAEVEKLRDQLARVNAEKAEVTSKYEKLSAICRSQRQEIQDLKQALASRTPSPNKDSAETVAPPSGGQLSTPPSNEKMEGTIWELQQGFFDRGSAGSDSNKWQAFPDDSNPKPRATPTNNPPKSVRTRNGSQNKEAPGRNNAPNSSWGFDTDAFKVAPSSGTSINTPVRDLNNSQRFREPRGVETKVGAQPSGWAGF